MYNSIPSDLKPPPGASQLQYVDAFDSDFALLLRKRRSTTLTDMMNDETKVEVNLMAFGKMKQRMETYKKKIKEEYQLSTSQSSNVKLYMMLKTMEKLVEKLYFDNKPKNREQQERQIKNPNFTRPQVPQIRQREHRNHGDQQIRPPFQDNFVNEYYVK
jgi:hypothetical protein